MLIVMKPDATEAQVEEVLQVIRALGFKPHPHARARLAPRSASPAIRARSIPLTSKCSPESPKRSESQNPTSSSDAI